MYTLDGIPPVDPAGVYKLLKGTAVRGFAGRRASALELPGMDGVVADTTAPFMSGGLRLVYRFFAADHATMMTTLERFNGIIGQRKLLTVSHAYGNGQIRTQSGIVNSPIQPELPICRYATYPVDLMFPNPFWRSPLTYTLGEMPATATATTLTVPALDGTGPISDSLIRFKGAFSTLMIRDSVTGDQISYDMPLTATQYLIVDCANWTARRVTTDTWTGGTDVSHQTSSNKGKGPMFTMEPDNILTGGRYRLLIQATNPASSPTVEVRARKSYH